MANPIPDPPGILYQNMLTLSYARMVRARGHKARRSGIITTIYTMRYANGRTLEVSGAELRRNWNRVEEPHGQ